MRTKTIAIIMTMLLLTISQAMAHSEHPEHEDFERAEAMINAEIPCEQLTQEELEIIGDYIMEQIHPGEAHEIMDERMGGEGSESLRQAHINMAERFYCSRQGGFMMMQGYGMMGLWPVMYYMGFWGMAYWTALIVLFIWLIAWLIIQASKKPARRVKKRK